MATTAKGQATKERIVQAAADLILARGIAGTSLDDVRAATGTSKSQLYHYFADKADLLRAVVAAQTERVLQAQRPLLESLDSWAGLQRWSEAAVSAAGAALARGDTRSGCPIGSLVIELADTDSAARDALASAFARWESYLATGLTAMRDRGELIPGANPAELAVATIASLQGGILLAQAAHSTQPLRQALEAALRYLRTWAAEPKPTPPGNPPRD